MNRSSKRIALVLAAAVMAMAGSAAYAVLAGGSVKGTVMLPDGSPAANVRVAIVKPMEGGPGGPGGPGAGGNRPRPGQKAAINEPVAGHKPPAGDRPRRPEPVASGETDAEGKFELKDVPAGEYVVRAGARDVGMGQERITVKDGEEVIVEIKMKERRQGGGGGGGAK